MGLAICRMAAPGAKAGQLGNGDDLDAPAFVIGQMQVQLVQLVARHQVEQSEHRSLRLKITRHIKHHAAIFEARRIDQVHCLELQTFRRLTRQRQDAAQRLQTAIQAGGTGACQQQTSALIDRQFIGFSLCLAGNHADAQAQSRLGGGAASGSKMRAEQFGGERCFTLQARRSDDSWQRAPMQLTCGAFELQRRREYRWQRLDRQVGNALIAGEQRLRGHQRRVGRPELFSASRRQQLVVGDRQANLGFAVVDKIRRLRRFVDHHHQFRMDEFHPCGLAAGKQRETFSRSQAEQGAIDSLQRHMAFSRAGDHPGDAAEID